MQRLGAVEPPSRTFSRMFSASPTVVPPLDDGAMPYTSSPRYFTWVGARRIVR